MIQAQPIRVKDLAQGWAQELDSANETQACDFCGINQGKGISHHHPPPRLPPQGALSLGKCKPGAVLGENPLERKPTLRKAELRGSQILKIPFEGSIHPCLNLSLGLPGTTSIRLFVLAQIRDIRVVRWTPASGSALTVDSLFLSLCFPLPLSPAHSRSKINKSLTLGLLVTYP